MLSLYWKIFVAFWLATILLIFTTAWITSEITKTSSIPVHERVFMDSYAHAAVATYESGRKKALEKWLAWVGSLRKMHLYLLASNGEIIGQQGPPEIVQEIAERLVREELDEGLVRLGNILISHEILSTSGKAYRLAAVSDKPLGYLLEIPWGGLTLRLTIAISLSGLICYLLSLFLTQPLRSLRMATKSLAKGELNTRVSLFKGHYYDEIAELSEEFNQMAEQIESMIRSKERLLQDLSHELRSPLARLQIALELGRQKTERQAEAEFQRMERECARLGILIDEILSFARLHKPFLPLNKTILRLSDLLRAIIDDASYEFSLEEHALSLKTEVDPWLTLDPQLMHRALENIIRNAIRYAWPCPFVNISLRLDSQKKYIHLLIEDNGPGVPEEALEKIFHPFYRVDPSREKQTGGYGLGLAIAYQAIVLHEGQIKASNRKEGGLVILIILPYSLSSSAQTLDEPLYFAEESAS